MTNEHCQDCCCAKSWEALGIASYTGKSIPEEIASLRQRLAAAEEAKLDAQDDARAQFARYMDCAKAYRALQDRLAAAEALLREACAKRSE